MRLFRLLLLVAGLAGFAAPTAAEAPLCQGRDLTAELKSREPERWARIEAAAAKLDNGRSTFWKIEAPNGAKPSWLLGTMHLSDPRVTTLPPKVAAALDGAGVLAVENTTSLDPKADGKSLGPALKNMIYTDGRTLAGVLGPDDWAALKKTVEARRLPGWAVMGWKPWAVVFSLSIYPPCELARWLDGKQILDASLVAVAKAAGKPVKDLEEVTDQFAALDSMSEADQIALLKGVVRREDQLPDLQETQLRHYVAGRVDLLWAYSAELFGREDGAAAVDSLLANAAYKRNHGMVARARPLIDAGNAFLAVGALHLIGEQGLVRLLREAGYTVTAVE